MSFEAKLCKEIIAEDFGVFTATVANQLLLKGRLTINDLTRLTKYPIKRVREALIVLIHHGIIYFSEPTDDRQRDTTFYEIDSNKIIARIRMGRIMRITEEHYGKAGSAICQFMFLYGRVKLSQVQEWAKTNDTKQKDEAAYVRAFTQMAIEQFIVAALPQHSRSITDEYLQAEQDEYSKYTITTAKDIQIIKQTAKKNVDAIFDKPELVGLKRKAEDPLESQAKRFEEVYDIDEPEENDRRKSKELLYDTDSNVFFTLNFTKYNLHFRNQMVADFATSRINKTAGIVIKTFFRSGKHKMKEIKDEYSPAATPAHIANMLDANVFLRGDIKLRPDPSEPRKKPSVLQVVRGYFKLLRVDSAGFLASRDELGANQYSVNLKKIRYAMKRRLFEDIVTDRFGIASCRIIRILLDKGKLDESQIQKLAMLPPKDVRHKLGELMTAGLVEIQEVPRSTDRAPSRTFHLWFVDMEKCFQGLLADVFQTITKLQQRKVEELARRSRLLDKLNRKDVIANMELLNEIDKVEVAKMEKVVERIEIAKGRLDEMVMILKDF